MFGPKHRLRYSLEQPQRRSMFLGKILKISIFPGEIMNFYMSKMSVCVLHGQAFAQALEVITINH